MTIDAERDFERHIRYLLEEKKNYQAATNNLLDITISREK